MSFNVKKIAAVLAALFAVSYVSAEIKVVSVYGKCEYENNGVWSAIEAGQSLTKGTKIQTGFKSGMVLDMTSENQNSKLTVAQLTRMTIDQLISSETLDKTNISLTTGSMKSEINRTGKAKVNFTVKSPVATASVRGTITEYKNVVKGLSVATERGHTSVCSNSYYSGIDLDDENEIQLPKKSTEVLKKQETLITTSRKTKTPLEIASGKATNTGTVKTAAEEEVVVLGKEAEKPETGSGSSTGNMNVSVNWE